jgi:hypothetical protein
MDKKDVITFKGNRELWIDFISKVKKERKTVWDVLEALIQNYLKK